MEKIEGSVKLAQEPGEGVRQVWVGESERIVSFHPVEGYRRECFTCQDTFIRYLRQLQEHGFRFQ